MADGTVYCSFCGKSQCEVSLLFAVSASIICDECVDLAAHVVTELRMKAALRLAETAKEYGPCTQL